MLEKCGPSADLCLQGAHYGKEQSAGTGGIVDVKGGFLHIELADPAVGERLIADDPAVNEPVHRGLHFGPFQPGDDADVGVGDQAGILMNGQGDIEGLVWKDRLNEVTDHLRGGQAAAPAFLHTCQYRFEIIRRGQSLRGIPLGVREAVYGNAVDLAELELSGVIRALKPFYLLVLGPRDPVDTAVSFAGAGIVQKGFPAVIPCFGGFGEIDRMGEQIGAVSGQCSGGCTS